MAPQPNVMYVNGTQPIGLGVELRRQAREMKSGKTNTCYNTKANFAASRPYVSEKNQQKRFREEQKAEKRRLEARNVARQIKEKENRARGK
jgi:hypothetical protein